ncbi:MAG: hypothetical protein M1823_006137 [Watsoniomyces obsoletus]|nr:MAG: hypothetical protein M1823_006137 [Watsoniomyces obsoletus]
MFHRRPRTPSNAHLNPDPTPSASIAAAQAFLANRASNASLSAAAAAAALRSHTTSPVAVGAVQTKRTLQRQNVTAGPGSPTLATTPSGPLRRRGSSGSMSERSFRAASPERVGAASPSDAVPPVPALPQELPPLARSPAPVKQMRPATAGAGGTPQPPPVQNQSRRRASSTEVPAGFPRLGSPPPMPSHGRGMSVDGGVKASPGVLAAQRASGIGTLPPRPESRGSVNFSYPIGPRSPTPLSEEQLAPSRLASPPPSTIQSGVGPAAVKPKKKKSASEGGLVARPATAGATMGQGLARENILPLPGVNTQTGPLMPKKKKSMGSPVAGSAQDRAAMIDRTSSPLTYHSDLDTISEDGDQDLDRPSVYKTRAGALLIKRPSVVHEQNEQEEGPDDAQARQAAAKAQGAAGQSRQRKPDEKVLLPAPPGRQGPGQHTRSASQPAPDVANPSTGHVRSTGSEAGARAISSGRGRGASQAARPQSLSPTRHTHFAMSPTTAATPLAIKHEPPPRSLSPAKSALRKSPSPRPGSAASEASIAGFAGSASRDRYSTDSPITEPDTSVNRRRKVSRVSFDEDSVVIGDEADVQHVSLPPTSPPGDSANVRLGEPRAERNSRAGSDAGEEEYMTPRPALPLFGSIRRRKGNREEGQAAGFGTGESPITVPLETSSDHAIGGILSQALTGNPPASTLSSDREIPYDPNISIHHTTGDTSMLTVAFNQASQPGVDQLAANDDVLPSIEFTQPTPNLEQSEPFVASNAVSGGDGSGSNHPVDEETHARHDFKPPSPTPALAGVAEPEPDEAARNHTRSSPTVGHFAEGLRLQTEGLPVVDHSDDETDGSLYSDAAEDIARTEGDGFGSIDAVVDSPTVESAPGVAITTPPESPIKMPGKKMNGIELEPIDTGLTEPSSRSEATERQRHEEEQAVPAAVIPQLAKPKMKKKKASSTATSQLTSAPTMRSMSLGAIEQQPATAASPKPKARQRVAPGNGVVTNSAGNKPQHRMAAATQQSSYQGRQNSLPTSSTPVKATPPKPLQSANDRFNNDVQKELRKMGATRATSPIITPPKKGRLMKSSLKRSDSNSSASSSSFKKSRTRSSGGGGGMALRRTMRPDSSSPAPPATAVPSSRYSVRSLSPVGSTRKPMRSSLRGPASSSGGTPSLRQRPMSADQAKPASGGGFRGFGKTSKPKVASSSSKFGHSSRRRFSDSSEDDTPMPAFRGRYDDSSDEDEPRPTSFAPVRGIPRRIGEEDEESSQLPDSSDEERRVQRGVVASKKAEPGALSSKTLRDPEPARPASKTVDFVDDGSTGKRKEKHKKHRSLFSTLSGSRRKEESRSATMPSPANGTALEPSPRPQLTKRSSSVAVTPSVEPTESWPIPPPPPTSTTAQRLTSVIEADVAQTQQKRPTTSDGVSHSHRLLPWGKKNRPEVGTRRTTNPIPPSHNNRPGGSISSTTATGIPPLQRGALQPEDTLMEGNEEAEETETELARERERERELEREREKGAVYGRNGKKKKFGALRRVFGLKD